MWWRVAKRGAFQADTETGCRSTAYKTWKDRVADGLAIDRPYRPEFTFGVMDSIQIGILPQKNRFLSRFSEKDDDFLGETSASDMLPDNIFRPGTRIEYFFTANYLKSPNDKYYYPDTTGASYAEFEVLPGVRTANVANCGGTGLNYCAYHPGDTLRPRVQRLVQVLHRERPAHDPERLHAVHGRGGVPDSVRPELGPLRLSRCLVELERAARARTDRR